MKANNHPAIKDLRAYLDKHKLRGAVLVAVAESGEEFIASAGKTVKSCNALGKVLHSSGANLLWDQIDEALERVGE